MEDKEIIRLFYNRDEVAIKYAEEKYGRYLKKISMNILNNSADSEEVINDALMVAWKNIPPKCPDDLKLYLAKIVRYIALDRLKYENAEKRGGKNTTIIFDELENVFDSVDGPERRILKSELKNIIMSFLDQLPELDRNIMVRRYWFFENSSEIASRYSLSSFNVRKRISRINHKFKIYLEEKGVYYD